MSLPRTLMGVETEYALTGRVKTGRGDLDLLAGRLMRAVREEEPHLPDGRGSGVFLANGARVYVDCGRHPEFATPECATPWDVLRYIKAGERVLHRAATHLAELDPDVLEAVLFRCNVDYSGAGTTWGCHESYLYRSDPALLPVQLIPHLASRVIYTGAGGFNPSSPRLEFTLSPRAWMLQRVVSKESTQTRGIFHTKNESLSDGRYHRLHVISGESLCSETATLLKLGTTALIVAALDAGARPGDDVQLVGPLPALRRFASDPSCSSTVPVEGGRTLTAIEIQRHYLQQVEACRARGLLPDWSGRITALWGEMLDRLEAGPRAVGRTLDWAIKYALYERSGRERASAGRCAGRTGLMKRGLLPFLGEKRAAETTKRPPLRLSQEMLEADWRFGQLGVGVFEQLDGAGQLAHRVLEPGDIERALREPPGEGRARARGEWVRRLAGTGKSGQYLCDWTAVWDRGERRYVDLADPLIGSADWRPSPGLADRAGPRRLDWLAALSALE